MIQKIFSEKIIQSQEIPVSLISAALDRKALPNAYLLVGRALQDKWVISKELASFLNCKNYFAESSQEKPCYLLFNNFIQESKELGTEINELELKRFCQNCLWIAKDEHPQAFITLIGQGESRKIPVEKVRLLVAELSKTSSFSRVVVIPQAEQEFFHTASANALLKSIEEPPKNTIFILFAQALELVLPTIVSRCQIIPLRQGQNFENKFLMPDISQARFDYLKSELIHLVRRSFNTNFTLHTSHLKTACQSQELFDFLLSTSDSEPDLMPECLIDTVCFAEIETLRDYAIYNNSVSYYLQMLLNLAENAKASLKHYVKKNNVFETFCFSLTELKMKHLGEFNIVK